MINAYLWCGYLPPDEFPAWLSECITPECAGQSYSPHEAADRFDSLFDNLVDQSQEGRHIIPLSGGWDSRAILGALLERVDVDRIVTVSFGAPGQLDSDLGKMVADSVGVEHYALDLRSIQFTWEAIREYVHSSPWTLVPDGMFNSLCRNSVSNRSDTIWGGFGGGLTGGGHLSYSSTHPDQNIADFSAKQQRVKTLSLCHPEFLFKDYLPLPKQDVNLNYDDLLHQGIRQAYCIAPIIIPIQKWERVGALIGKDKSDARVIAPFADPAWAGYWLSAPREVRKGQKLYLEMLRLKFPALFLLPGKSDLGINQDCRLSYLLRKVNQIFRTQLQRRAPWLGVRSSLMHNYLDYGEMFCHREDYQNTMVIAFKYLMDNQVVPWLDLDALWNEHIQRRKDHRDAFLVLLGLAANLVENPLDEGIRGNS